MNINKGILMTALSAVILLLSGVPAFADAIGPGPGELLGSMLLDFLPVILIVIAALGAVTGIVLLIVFQVRKKKRREKEGPKA